MANLAGDMKFLADKDRERIMQLNRYIDHTLLRPNASKEDILRLCHKAIECNFYGVCVNSCWIELVAQQLAGSPIIPISVVGFPLGAMDQAAKAFEAERAVDLGAKEIDMVINLGMLKSGMMDEVEADIRGVVDGSRPVKVIIETALLSDEEKILACELSMRAGAHFVKTCTGFNGGAATVADIQLMKSVVGDRLGIKASGGIKTAKEASDLIEAGATRLGTSSALDIVSTFQ